jgi:hypothetical protein
LIYFVLFRSSDADQGRGLLAVGLGVGAVAGEELGVGALFDDRPGFEDDDPVGG